MASRLLGVHSTPLHDDVAAYAFSFLAKEDRKNLASVNKRNREFIQTKYPKYDRTVPKYKELTTLQKLELEFIKFQDRPVWERVCIVALCVVLSPAILIYHSPTLLKKFCITVIDPCARIIGTHLEAAAIKIYNKVLAPLGECAYDYALVPFANALRKIAIVTYDYLLTPLGNAIYEVAKFIFVTFPIHLYQWVLDPLARGVYHLFMLTDEYILTPLARVIESVFTGGVVRMLCALYTHVLEPAGRALGECLNSLYDRLLLPLANVISVVAEGLFVTFPTKVWNHVIDPAINLTLDYVIIPLATKTWEALTLLFHYVLSPVGQAIGRFFSFSYEVILTPMGQLIQKVASAIFNELIVPLAYRIQLGAEILYTAVLAPLGTLIVSLPSIVAYAFSGNS